MKLGQTCGTVQVDGYAGHSRLGRTDRPGGVLTLCAGVHGRLGLRDVFYNSASPIAKAGLEPNPLLYRIKEKIRPEPPATRQVIRWADSAPLFNVFGVCHAESPSCASRRFCFGESLTKVAKKMNDAEPYAGLNVILRAFANAQPNCRIDELLT